jgi:outer membrane protein OmpA-like peptidoglycan-associated protein
VIRPLVAQIPVPAPDINGLLGKVLFETGKSELDPAAQDIIKAAAALLGSHPDVKVAISGYADRTGTPDANLELAKQRAFAVRDALKAGGVAENRIDLKKPEFVIGGVEADARRVEIAAAR